MRKPKQNKKEAPKELTATEEKARRLKDFQRRVQRVIAAMQKEQVDFRGVPYIAPDGRVGANVVPVDKLTE